MSGSVCFNAIYTFTFHKQCPGAQKSSTDLFQHHTLNQKQSLQGEEKIQAALWLFKQQGTVLMVHSPEPESAWEQEHD